MLSLMWLAACDIASFPLSDSNQPTAEMGENQKDVADVADVDVIDYVGVASPTVDVAVLACGMSDIIIKYNDHHNRTTFQTPHHGIFRETDQSPFPSLSTGDPILVMAVAEHTGAVQTEEIKEARITFYVEDDITTPIIFTADGEQLSFNEIQRFLLVHTKLLSIDVTINQLSWLARSSSANVQLDDDTFTLSDEFQSSLASLVCHMETIP